MIPPPSHEFCALSFLTQWLKIESALHSAISVAPTEVDIRKALNYFQVARIFKGLNTDKLITILHSLNKIRNNDTLPTPHEKVDGLARTFQKKFGTLNLSAASKLLWLSCRNPFIVYDNRAVAALSGHFRYKFKKTSYTEYANVWREEYVKCGPSIEAVVEKLPRGRMFARYLCPLSDEELVRMAKEAWFMERVFDTFLWEVGEKQSAG